MKWIHNDNGDWVADGEDGDFLVWKEGALWKGRYRSKDHKIHFFLPRQRKLTDMKRLCEDNNYWERESVAAKKEKKEIMACLNCKIPVEKCKGLCYRNRRSAS